MRDSRFYKTWAIIFGFISSILIYGYLKSITPPSLKVIKVVVARKNIPAGLALTPSMLEIKQIPRKWLPAKVAVKAESLIGLVALVPIYKGEPILMQRLTRRYQQTTTGFISRGKRGFTLTLEKIGILENLKIGNKVDVLVTLSRGLSASADTQTVARRKLVIGISRRSPAAVTLLVTPKEAEKLAWAEANGRITLALCPDEK